ncbi:MAG: hypothetical protein C4313_08575 [Thermoflexus sp.]|uniref:Flp family type IVb pilin n=1 Tax=Thermoflexus sp. TaxID=1969742 RepID=UPI00332882BC
MGIPARLWQIGWWVLEGYETLCHPVRLYPRLRRWGRSLARRLQTDERGQNLIEYIIAVGGVFLVAAAVYALYRALQSKYQQATNSVNQIPIESP